MLTKPSHWNDLQEGWTVGRINHSEAYSQNGANTNQAESYFSRLRGTLGHPILALCLCGLSHSKA